MSTISTQSHKHIFQMVALLLCVVAFVGVIMVGSTTVAYCAGENQETIGEAATNIQEAFSKMTKKIYDVMRAVIIPCCIVALGLAGFQFLFGGTKGAEKARTVVIGVIAAVCFVVFAPIVMSTVGGMVAENGASDDWDAYNPLVD